MSHFQLVTLPSGERELSLRPIGGKVERLVYGALAVAMLLGGFLLLPALFGWAVLGVGVISSLALYRTFNRKETWQLKPGSATRTVTGFGSSRATYVPVRVHALAEEETEDYRKVYRLMLEHQAGKVQIGTHTFDRDERAVALAKAFAEAAGVDAVLP